MAQKRVDLWFGYFARMTDIVKKDEPLDPSDLGRLCSATVMPHPERFTHLIQ